MSQQRTVPRPSFIMARKRRWDFLALLVVLFLFVLVLFTLLPIWSSSAAAVSTLPAALHAKETADYGKDPLGTVHPAVGLGIIEEVLKDENPFASDIDERLATLTQEILKAVPTSTQMRQTSTRESTGGTVISSASPAAATGTVGPIPTDTPTPLVVSTWTATPSLTSIPLSTSAGTGTITPTPTRTVTLPPGVTATFTHTPTRTVTLPPGITPTGMACETYPSSGFVAEQDAWIDESRPNSSNATSPKLQVQPSTGAQMQALIQFDLSTIPAGSTILSATLYLNVTKSSTYIVEFREIFSSWAENVTWNLQPEYDLSVISGELQLNASQPGNCARSVELDTGLIEYWVDNPDLNYGLMLVASDLGERSDFSSIDSNRPPRLIIQTP
ncbi:MAG: DNRLRE domain-containing protein [Chloroflexota bacterium]